DLPWRLPADLKRFKVRTWGKPVIMGRKTHESIGRALPGRRNLVLSRGTPDLAADVERVDSLEAARVRCAGEPEVMIIGGAGLYQAALPVADRLYLTLVRGLFDGDTWFPALPADTWRIVDKHDHPADAKNRWAHTEFILERGAGGAWPPELAGWIG
ncbi:MAG: dihydrofolate reductase, partial [Myxococcales bacterium]|nr:dihydrofolate reductase [Myxococcales bacterium]